MLSNNKEIDGKPSSKVDIFELETEFFGFTPISFIDDVVNVVNEYMYAAADSLQSFVENIDSGIPLSEIHKVGCDDE
jgi:hypothetical protein